jgi:hypothetical protein
MKIATRLQYVFVSGSYSHAHVVGTALAIGFNAAQQYNIDFIDQKSQLTTPVIALVESGAYPSAVPRFILHGISAAKIAHTATIGTTSQQRQRHGAIPVNRAIFRVCINYFWQKLSHVSQWTSILGQFRFKSAESSAQPRATATSIFQSNSIHLPTP